MFVLLFPIFSFKEIKGKQSLRLEMSFLQSVEGMKVVCHELAQATSDPEGSAMDELVKDADRLVSCLANKVITNYDFIKIINAALFPFFLFFFFLLSEILTVYTIF